MSMTYATISGLVTRPGSDIGIRARVKAVPMTAGGILTFASEGRLTWGPAIGTTGSDGSLSIDIPTGHGLTDLYWRVIAEPLDTSPGISTWTLGTYQITEDADLADLVDVDVVAVTPDLEERITALVADAEAAALLWQPSVAVTSGATRQAPDGSRIKSTAPRTTRSSFDATEKTFWKSVLGTAGTMESDDLSASYDPKLSSRGTGAGRTVRREFADANKTASKWREVFGTANFNVSGTDYKDPVLFVGWNADKGLAGGDAAEPTLYMGMEADYRVASWNGDGTPHRVMEWYVNYNSPDNSTVTNFRPFMFSLGADSNASHWATVQVDIGDDIAQRSVFMVVPGQGNNALMLVNKDQAVVRPSLIALTGLGVGDPTTATDKFLTLNGSTGRSIGTQFGFAGSAAWQQYLAGGDANNIYLRDLQNSRMHATYTAGASASAANTRLGSKLKVDGASLIVSSDASNDALKIAADSATQTSFEVNGIGTQKMYLFAAFSAGTALSLNTADNTAALVAKSYAATQPAVIARAAASQTASIFEAQQHTSSTPLWSITAAGVPKWNASGNQQTTVGAAGGASALPATPTKYLKVVDSAGTTYVIPAYAAS